MRALMGLLALLFGALPAMAETTEVRIAQQTSIAFLQFNVMKHQGLIEKHAAALGVPGVKVTFATFNGPDAMNDALLSGAVDIVSGGPPGLLVVWAKTWGSSQEVRGVGALSQLHWLLNTRNPNVHSIRDFTAIDRIAMPAVKVAAQSVLLEMAAAKEWGDKDYEKLDALTLAMSPSDATAGLLSGGGNFNSAFTVPPFQEMQLKDPAVHTVLDSRDILGASSSAFAWSTKKFHDANPKVFLAVVNAMKEASDYIMSHSIDASPVTRRCDPMPAIFCCVFGSLSIAVRTRITARAPHGTVRAVFPHTAPTLAAHQSFTQPTGPPAHAPTRGRARMTARTARQRSRPRPKHTTRG